MQDDKGFSSLVALLGVVLLGLSVSTYLVVTSKQPQKNLAINQAASSEVKLASTAPTPSASSTTNPSTTPSPQTVNQTPKATSKVNQPPRPVTAYGFAFEDTNNDLRYTQGERYLPDMKFFYYDSATPNLPMYTYHAGADGSVFFTLNVKGNLVVKPMQFGGYRPVTSPVEFLDNTTSKKAEFGFRVDSETGINQGGVIEGDFIQDSNQNQQADADESSVHFYKFYLVDSAGNSYTPTNDTNDGHFKYENLTLNKTYKLQLSTLPELFAIYQSEYQYSLSNSTPTIVNIKIPVFKK